MTHHQEAVSGKVPNLVELLRLIRADSDVSKAQRAWMINGVQGLIKFADLNPATTKAGFLHCRAALMRIEPSAVGITRPHLLNIRYGLRLAFARYAGGYNATKKPVSRGWARLRAKPADQEPYLRLIRFVRWCDANEISPVQVNDKVTHRYFEHLQTETTVLKPKDSHRLVCLFWNRMAASGPGWPKTKLAVPSYRIRIALPIEDFPKSFRTDLASWKRSLGSTPLGRTGGPSKPLREVTIRNMVGRVMRFASILVREGVPIREITNLESLTKANNFRLGMHHFWDKANCRPTRTQYEIARTIVVIARHWVRAHPARIFSISDVARRLRLPLEAEKAATRGRFRYASRLMQRAVAIELLLIAPIRMRNLIGLQLGTHFRSDFRDGRRTVCLVIQPDEVKNDATLEFELPTETVELVGNYLSNYRAHLVSSPTQMLFPGKVDGHKGPVLGLQIQNAVKRYTGFTVHPHAFRHIAAKLYLKRRPEDYLPISLLLGHKSVDTTKMYYSDLEMRASARRYAEEVLGRRFAE